VPHASHSPSCSWPLSGTVGQPETGAMSGGNYTLAGGFWGGGAIQYSLYLPVVVR